MAVIARNLVPVLMALIITSSAFAEASTWNRLGDGRSGDVLRTVVFLLALVVAAPGMPSPVTFAFVGDVFGTPAGIFAGESSVSGMYIFDSELVASTAASDSPAEINIFTTPGNEFIDNWFISATIGSVTTPSADNALLQQSQQPYCVLEFNVG